MKLDEASLKGFDDGYKCRQESSLTVETMFMDGVGLASEAEDLRNTYAYAYGRGVARQKHDAGTASTSDFMDSFLPFSMSGLSASAQKGYSAEREKIATEKVVKEQQEPSASGGVLNRLFPPGRRPDVVATLKVNALRLVICGITLFVGALILSDEPAGPALFAPIAAVIGSLACNLMSRIGIPFAGLFDMFFRCFLIVGDPFLRLTLPRLEQWLGGQIQIGWINFAPLILIASDHSVVEIPTRRAMLKSAARGGRDKAAELIAGMKKK